MMSLIESGMRFYKSFEGRMGREDFSFYMWAIYLFGWVLTFPVFVFLLPHREELGDWTFYLAWVIATSVPKLWCCIKRCHDFGRSGVPITLIYLLLTEVSILCKYDYLPFLDIVPIEMVIMPLIFIALSNMSGDERANKYGEIPYDSYTKQLFNNGSGAVNGDIYLDKGEEEAYKEKDKSTLEKVSKSKDGKDYIINEDGTVTFIELD